MLAATRAYSDTGRLLPTADIGRLAIVWGLSKKQGNHWMRVGTVSAFCPLILNYGNLMAVVNLVFCLIILIMATLWEYCSSCNFPYNVRCVRRDVYTILLTTVQAWGKIPAVLPGKNHYNWTGPRQIGSMNHGPKIHGKYPACSFVHTLLPYF